MAIWFEANLYHHVYHLADRDLNIYSGELELGIPSINQIPPKQIVVTVPLAMF